MSQRTVLITGASDGIGAATARKLATEGDRLLLVGRSPEKTRAVAGPLGAEFFVADFERLSEVRDLATQVLAATDHIDVLVNNAGGVFGERVTTVDGNERTMQVNHYAGFLLTNLLIDVLRDSDATIVNTSSVGARAFGRLDMANLDNAGGRYKAMKAYGDSKLANILFAKGLHAYYHSDGINAVALHPGNIASNFGNAGSRWMKAIYRSPLARLLDTPDDGAGNLIWAINGTPGETWQSGEYYEPRTPPRRPNPQQNDPSLVDALWRESARRVGLTTTN